MSQDPSLVTAREETEAKEQVVRGVIAFDLQGTLTVWTCQA